MDVIKCSFCNKAYISTGDHVCPFCKNQEGLYKDMNNDMPDFMKDIFGNFGGKNENNAT